MKEKKKRAEASAPSARDEVVYRDSRYTLGRRDGRPYLTAAGKTFLLSCHPYAPCLYITDESGCMTTVQNAFDPSAVLECLQNGDTITSITGRRYDAHDFCRMTEYAAGVGEIGIDDAEKVFGCPPSGNAAQRQTEAPPACEKKRRSENGGMLSEALCCEVVDTLPDDVIEYCLVQNRPPYRGYASHRSALARACETLFPPDDEDAGWTYDVGMAEGKKIAPDELFAPVCREGRLNFRKAFLHPPHGSANTDADFEKLNDTLFPNGRAHLDVYAWTTDWSDYFDDGHEWWGALCFTVYDDRADRFVVILASATD